MDYEILEEIISANSDGMFAVDCDYQILYWSKSMEQLSQLNRTHTLQQNLFETYPVLKNTEEEYCYIQAFNGQKIVSQNNLYIACASDKKFYFKNYYSPLRSVDGQVIGAIVIVRDLTQNQEAEQKIKESEERFRIMADYAPVAIWMSRKDGLCNYFNQGWLDFSGRNLEEEFGVGWADRIHPEDFQKAMDTYLSAFNARESFTMKYRLQRYDGEFRWLLDNGRPRYTECGEFLGYIGSCIDITDQIMALNELDNTIKQLEVALQVRDDFISIASHELKTPLTPLKIYIHTLKIQLPKIVDLTSSASKIFLNIIEKMDNQLNYILKLIDDLLDFSRVSNSHLPLTNEKTDLTQVVRELVKHCEVTHPHVHFTLSFSHEKCIGQWDRVHLEQIITNILDNAIKFGMCKPIKIDLLEENMQLKLSIKDEGIGIPKNVQSTIFNKFERAVSSKNYAGLGLGLYIVKQYVSLYGGTISIDSDIGKGATFHIFLPIKPVNSSDL